MNRVSKRLVFVCLSLFLNIPSMAQVVEVPLAGRLDLSKFVSSTRADFVYDRSGMKLAGAHIPLITLHDASGREFVNLNGGLAWDTVRGVGGPFVALGGRIDNIAAKIGQWEPLKKHIAVIGLPPIELGPFGGFVANQGWLFGGFVAVGLGGK